MGRVLQQRGASAPHPNRGRSRALTALARRAAGLFLLVTPALLAFAPEAGAQGQTTAPQNVAAVVQSDTSVKITWSPPAQTLNGDAVTEYRRRHRPTAYTGTWNSVSGFAASDRETTFDGLGPGTSYDFQVRACTSTIHCGTWGAATATTTGTPAAGPSLLAREASDGSVALRWTFPSSGTDILENGDPIRVEYKKTETASWTGASAETFTHPTFVSTISGLDVGASYDFRARGTSSWGDTAWSEVVAVAGKPDSPGSFAATTGTTPGSVDLSWNAPTNNGGKALTSYLLQWRPDATGNWADHPATGSTHPAGTATGFTLGSADGLEAGATYNFRIRSSNGDRESFFTPNDGSVEAATAADPNAPPGKVPNVQATTDSSTQITFTWGEPTTGGTFGWYQYHHRTPGTDWANAGGQISTQPRSVGQFNRHPGTTYDYRVRACKSVARTNCGEWSDTASATTHYIPPAQPRNYTAAALNDNNHGTDRLMWDPPANTGVTGYKVQRRQASQTAWETAVDVTGTSYDYAKASGTSGSAYHYRIRSSNPIGSSAYTGFHTVAGRPTWKSGAAGTPAATAGGHSVSLDWTGRLASDGGSSITHWRYRWKLASSSAWTHSNTNIPAGTTTFTVPNLTPNTAYDFDVIAYNANRQSLTSADARATTLNISPRNLQATVVSGTQVDLTWEAPNVSDPESVLYLVQYRAGSGNPWITFTKNIASTFIEVTGLEPSTTYQFDVTGGSQDSYSITNASSTSATTLNIGASVTATDPSPLTEGGLHGARLTVDLVGTQYASSLSLGHFGLNPTPANTSISGIQRVSNTRAVLTLGFTGDFPNDTTIAVTVSTHGHTGSGQLTTPAVQIKAETAPAVVVTTSANGGAGTVQVNWNAAAGADGYKVQWKGPGENYDAASRELEVGAGARTATIPGLASSTTYTVRVVATKRLAPDGPPSLELMATTDAIGASISATDPSPLTERTLDGAELTVDLAGTAYASSLSASQFTLMPSRTVSGLSVASVQRVSNTRAMLTLAFSGNISTDLELSVEVASAATGHSAALTTAPVTVTQAPTPARVEGVMATGGPGSLDVTWDADSNADGYVVRWKLTSESNYAPADRREVPGGSTTQTTIDGLEGEASYDVFVFATSNFASDGPNSQTATATTLAADPGVAVSAADPLTVAEGASATYAVRLIFEPAGNVVIRVRVTGNRDVTVDTDAQADGNQGTLTFTPGNYRTLQTVTVSAARDADAADDTATITHSIVASQTSNEYDRVAIDSVSVIVTDDDTAGLTLSRELLSVNEGDTATWTAVLDTQPTSTVRLALTSADPSAVTVSPAGLTFTRSNWNRPRTVTVRGVDDPDADSETVAVTHAVVDASSADEYDAVADADVTVTTVDDDTPGLRVGALSRALVPEGGTATYTLRLNTAPASDVVVRVSSDNPDVTVRPAELTFTSTHWHRAQTVTVRAASDGDAADDTAALTHAVVDARSSDEYDPVSDVDLAVRVDDDDVAGVTLSALSPSRVSEGASALYTVVLDAQPTASVVIDIASDNADVSVDRPTLTFRTNNWDRAQTVTVTAAEDADAANDTATLTHTVRAAASADEYDAVAIGSVAVAVDDNDDEGVTVRAGRLALVEGDADAGSATYTLVLDAWPEGSVWVEATSSDPGAVRVSPDHVRFTGLDLDHPPLPEGQVPWNVPQRVTVTAVDDADGNAEAVTITHRVVLVNAGPAGGNYDDPIAIAAVRVTVADDDPPPALGQVTGVGVSPGVEQLSVRWRAVEGAERYTVQWRSGDETFDTAETDGRQATVSDGRTTYTIPGLTVGTEYRVRVIAANAMGDEGPPSDEVPGTPVASLPPPPPPPPPTGVDVSVADARAREGEPVTFTVRLVGEALSSALALAATPSSGPGDTAAADTDYVTAVQDLSISAGQTSATFSVATMQDGDVEPDETFTVTLSARPGAVLPAGVRIADATATGTIVDDDATSAVHHLPLFVPAADALGRQSFARIVNESDEAGEVRIDAFDDEGTPYGPLRLHLGAHEVAHFNSDDLENGNPARGLDGATGAGVGRWRLALTSDLDLRVLSYLRTRDGGLASMHDLVPRTEAGGHRVVFFNPASNTRRVSALRLINPGAEAAKVVIEGTDGAGESPGTAVSLSVPARGARRVTAQALESADARGEALRDLSGALGDGAGKWRLAVRSDQALQVMSLVSSPAGHLNNLSTAPGATPTDDGEVVHHLPLFVPTSDAFGRQSFARIVNESDEAGEVRIDAFDDAGEHYGPLTLYLDAHEAVQFNSRDLETGNPDQGLDGATGEGEGRWRLALASDLDLEVLGYLRMSEGGLSSMHDLVPRTEAGGHRVVFFNPASAMRRLSALRLVNPGTEPAEVVIEGTDDTGESPGTAVVLSVPAQGARMVTARALESADARGEDLRDLSGALGDGTGKWRLVVSYDEALQVMSLVSSPAGHLNNVSTAPPPAR